MVALALVLCGGALAVRADDWPQWRGPNRDGVWRESGVVEQFASEELPLLWSAPIGSGYSGPTVADGRVYVTDRVVEPKQIERVHCFSSATGESLWSYAYDCVYSGVSYEAGPRASVTIHDGRAYALGSMGHLHCFQADSGDLLWQRDLNAEYRIRMPIWGISASPLVYDDLLILQIGGEDNACLVALDRLTGEERWRALADECSYSAPILTKQAGHDVLVCWTGDNVVGLDPRSGDVHWQHPLKPTRMVIGIATPVREGSRLFVSSFYDGSLMLELDETQLAVTEVWRRLGPDEQHTDSLHSIISTPYLEGDYVYGVDSYGELRCLDAKTGDRLWEDLTATPPARWSTIHFVRNGERMWLFNERGELIIAELSPDGYREISRAHLIDPTTDQLRMRGGVCWAHPAFAERKVFARNDQQLVCADLAAQE